jgi:hypothetical protein
MRQTTQGQALVAAVKSKVAHAPMQVALHVFFNAGHEFGRKWLDDSRIRSMAHGLTPLPGSAVFEGRML